MIHFTFSLTRKIINKLIEIKPTKMTRTKSQSIKKETKTKMAFPRVDFIYGYIEENNKISFIVRMRKIGSGKIIYNMVSSQYVYNNGPESLSAYMRYMYAFERRQFYRLIRKDGILAFFAGNHLLY